MFYEMSHIVAAHLLQADQNLKYKGPQWGPLFVPQSRSEVDHGRCRRGRRRNRCRRRRGHRVAATTAAAIAVAVGRAAALAALLALALGLLALGAATATSHQFHFFEGQNAHDDLQLKTLANGLRHCSLFGFESLWAVTP